MSFLALLFLSLAMSTDAFTVAICKGVSLKVPKFGGAFKVGLLFGLIEGITPILGWLFGYIASHYIEKWGHWIIFLSMSFLGAYIIYSSFQEESDCQDNLTTHSIIILILTAISTSIDAFIIGIGLALASVNIIFAASMIGIVTCLMVTLGILLGKKMGSTIGKRAELIGGIIIIAIGFTTFY